MLNGLQNLYNTWMVSSYI